MTFEKAVLLRVTRGAGLRTDQEQHLRAADSAEADALMDEAEWDRLVDRWLGRAVPTGTVAFVDGAMIPLDELTAREYVDSDQLDLDDLTHS